MTGTERVTGLSADENRNTPLRKREIRKRKVIRKGGKEKKGSKGYKYSNLEREGNSEILLTPKRVFQSNTQKLNCVRK